MQYNKELMPITCGAYNSLPLPIPKGSHQAVPQGTPVIGSHQTMPTQHTFSPHVTPALPSGVSVGTTSSPAVPSGVLPANGTIQASQVPVTVESPLFTPGFLRTQIGRRVRVEFLLGTNLLTDRTGTLVGVGASYILLRLLESDDLMMCDIFSIKFVTIIL